MSKSFSQSEVASHNKTTDLYIIVDEDVYDLTKFQDEHPGEFSCLYAYNVDWTDSGQGGKKSTTSLNPRIPLFVTN
jgi:cytochrome b involved in lipid metabolism